MVMDIKNTFLQILEIVVRISKINTSDSLSKKTEQGIHRQTPPTPVSQRRTAHSLVPLRPNVTSSIKPDVHNVSQRHHQQDRTTATGDLHNKFRKNRSSGSRDMLVYKQTDRQTDRNTPFPYRFGVINARSACHKDGGLTCVERCQM